MNLRTRLPETLKARGIGLRAARDCDHAFLRDVYVAYRWEETAATGWPEAVRANFLADQFALQHRHYHANYPGADFLIVEIRGEPAGRLYLYRVPGDIRIMDIAFMPAWRNKGTGAALIEMVQDEARQRGDKVSIHVEQSNPAQNLYARLGFKAVKQDGIYILMEWRAGAPLS